MIRWLEKARKKVKFLGLPSRICWLGMGESEKAGLLFNDLVIMQIKEPLKERKLMNSIKSFEKISDKILILPSPTNA